MKATDLGITVGRDGADLGDLLVRGDVLGVLLEVRDNGLDREVDAALEVHRVHAGGDGLGTFPDDRMGEHGRRGGAVTGLVGGLRGDLAHHLRAHVLELVLELDLLGDGDAVLGDARRAVRLVEHDVAALGTERHAHRVGESVDAAQHAVASVDREFYFLGRHVDVLSAVDPHPEERPSQTSLRKLRTLDCYWQRLEGCGRSVCSSSFSGRGCSPVRRPSSWPRAHRARP